MRPPEQRTGHRCGCPSRRSWTWGASQLRPIVAAADPRSNPQGVPLALRARFRAAGRRRSGLRQTHPTTKEAAVNSVNLIGRITADPELRATPGDHKVVTLRVAVPRPGDGTADFFDVEAWN